MTEPITIDAALLYAIMGGLISWLVYLTISLFALKTSIKTALATLTEAVRQAKTALQGGAGSFAAIHARLDDATKVAIEAVPRHECGQKHDRVDGHLDRQDVKADATHLLVEQLDRKMTGVCGRMDVMRDLMKQAVVGVAVKGDQL